MQQRTLLFLLAVVVAVALAGKHKCEKGPCKSSSSSHKSSSSHSKEVKAKAASHKVSSESGEECKFECPACQAPEGHSPIFIGRDVIIDTQDGIIEPVNKGCACKAGTQYAYKAINPKYDFSALRTVKNVIVGRLRCARQEDICVESSDGQLYHGVKGNLLDIQPVPFTNGAGKTRTYLTVAIRGGDIDNGLAGYNATTLAWAIYLQNDASGETYGYEAQLSSDGNSVVRRLNFAEYPFVHIIGVDCSGCKKGGPKYCDKAIKKTYAL